MAFKKNTQSNVSLESPEAMYKDLKNREIQDLLPRQTDLIRSYTELAINEADVALQLATGGGKTLVGLVIGEWRRRKFREKVVYLCPTVQLANQVGEQATKIYGIKANVLTGKQADYLPNAKAEYRNAETLAISTYSALFNVNPFFDNNGLIILDDAHSAENYIAKYWSLSIEREDHQSLFKSIVSILYPTLSAADQSRMTSDLSDYSWVEKIPTPEFFDLIPELTTAIDTYLDQNVNQSKNIDSETKAKIDKVKYPLSVLKGHLEACHIYISSYNILIRPVIPPTTTHQSFSQAKQRLYMSATLGEGGELERITGRQNIRRLPIPDGWDKQGIGRRLFFFPERSLNQDDSFDLTIEMIKAVPRTLILTPDKISADKIKTSISQKTSHTIFDTKQIESSKQEFISNEQAIAILANRYDGIDFLDDECRLLIIQDLQKASHLQEKFLVTRLAVGFLFKDRVLTRMIQAFGRCTRSDTDYVAIVILGDDLNSLLLNPDTRQFLHPELQAEIEFGNQQSTDITIDDFKENLQIFLKHNEEWSEAEKEVIESQNSFNQTKLPAIDKLKRAVDSELKYQYFIWNKNYERAFSECQSVLNALDGDEVRGYRAFWSYLAGSAAWMAAKNGISAMESQAREFFKRAASAAPEVTWLSRLSRLSLELGEIPSISSRLNQVIEGLELKLKNLCLFNSKKFEAEVLFILDKINEESKTEESSRKFEEAHERLGQLLGYSTGRDNSASDAVPDVWWYGDDFCIVFEDHSSGQAATTLGANKVRQSESHPNWIREKVTLSKQAEIISVLITPCQSIREDAIPHAQNVLCWNLDDFRQWAEKAVTVVREVRQSFSGEESLDWRKDTIRVYCDAKLDPDSLMEMLKTNPLRDLKNPK